MDSVEFIRRAFLLTNLLGLGLELIHLPHHKAEVYIILNILSYSIKNLLDFFNQGSRRRNISIKKLLYGATLQFAIASKFRLQTSSLTN